MAGLALLALAAVAWGAEPAARAPEPQPAPEIFRARRAKLMQQLGDGVAVLYARGEEDRDGFRQDSDFYYLTGVSEPGAALVLAPKERLYKEILFLTPRDPEAERWTGERLSRGEALRKETGFAKVLRTSALERTMLRLLESHNTLHAIHKPSLSGGPEKELYGKLSGAVSGVSTKNRMDLLPRMRSLKEPGELALMRRAIQATEAAQRAAARALKPGVSENWLEALIGLEFKRAGAVRPAFGSIVGSGKNSTILHYPKHDQEVPAGALVVVDIGAEIGRYAADITRTYPADGKFTPEQRKVYEAVLRAQEECMKMIKPGVYYEDIHKKAEDVLAAAGYGDYFIHGLGHFVGLDVHDAGLYSRPLEAGMVVTVEPGVYIPEKALGVRIEDMVLVTEKGYELMSAGTPRAPEEVERLMSGPR